MTATSLLARSIRRRNRRQTVFLVLFAGLAGGAVLTSVGVARRTASAIDRYVARTEVADTFLIVCPEGRSPDDLGDIAETCGAQDDLVAPLDRIRAAPGVHRAGRAALVISAFRASASNEWNPSLHQVLIDPWPGLAEAPLVIRGRLPTDTATDEVAVNEALAAELGVTAGDRVQVGGYAASQRDDISVGRRTEPELGVAEATVTGVVRGVTDLPLDAEPTAFTRAGWWSAHGGDDRASYGKGIAIAFTDTAAERGLEPALPRLLPDRVAVANPTIEAAPSRRTTGLQSTAALIVAVAMAVAALAFVGQAITRLVRRDLGDRSSLSALGLTRRDLRRVVVTRIGPAAVASGVVALVVAVVASPLGPVGMARRVEVDPGVDVDPALLLAGAASVTGTVVAVAWCAASLVLWRRPRRSGPTLVSLPTWAPLGARCGAALLRRQDSSIVLGAVIGTAVAIVAAVFAAGVTASRTELLDHPVRYGQTWDRSAGDFSGQDELDAGMDALRPIPSVAEFDAVAETTVAVTGPGGRRRDETTLIAFARPGGRIDPVVIRGRQPSNEREIALGERTMRDLAVDLGDELTVTGPTSDGPIGPLTIVGTILVNDGVDSVHRVDEGGAVTDALFRQLDEPTVGQSLLVRSTDGAGSARLTSDLHEEFGDFVEVPTPPDDIRNLEHLSTAPVILALVVGLLAAGALVHALLTLTTRRRHDLAILRTLGFTRGQVVGAQQSVALLIAIASVLVGVPIGIVAIRRGWAQIREIVGIESPDSLPWAVVTAVAGATVLLALVVATVPALRTAGRRPAPDLRTE